MRKMFYCVPCPEPKSLGTHIATLVHEEGDDMYYWDANIRVLVLHKYDGSYYLLPNANIRESLASVYHIPGKDVYVAEFKLYEHNVDKTMPNDDARFQECNWSDYSYDGLRVWVRIQWVAAMDPQM